MSDFNSQSTTDEVLQGISLAGKTAVVTGATSGLGLETARALASVGAKVVILGRNKDKLAKAENELKSLSLAGDIETGVLDLCDLDQVRESAADLLSRFSEIHLLINNAGVMVCPLGRTAQGFEMQFGTNHVGHFLFTCLLMPALLKAAPARIVNLASAGHRISDINLDDPNYESTDYEKWTAYGASKTANVLFSVGLDQRLKDRGIRSYAVHPGAIETELSRHMGDQDRAFVEKSSVQNKTIPQGAATSVVAATSPELEGQGGVYLDDCQVAEINDQQGVPGGVKSYALDAERADKLWTISEGLVGETFSW